MKIVRMSSCLTLTNVETQSRTEVIGLMAFLSVTPSLSPPSLDMTSFVKMSICYIDLWHLQNMNCKHLNLQFSEQEIQKRFRQIDNKGSVSQKKTETHRLLTGRQSQKWETHKDRRGILKREIWHYKKTGNTNYWPGITRKTGLEHIILICFNVWYWATLCTTG